MHVTVCVLTYGDYPAYVSRCLDSVLAPPWRECFTQVRVGANAVSTRVHEQLLSYQKQDPRVVLYCEAENICKYPLMRKMFQAPIETEYTMWFDDDSAIVSTSAGWLTALQEKLSDFDFVGDYGWVVRPSLSPADVAKMRTFSWDTGKPIAPKFRFVTGGWWTIRTAVLKALDWPSETLKHNGGDVLLCHALTQQGFKIGDFTSGLAINADHTLRRSSAKRRGVSHKCLYRA